MATQSQAELSLFLYMPQKIVIDEQVRIAALLTDERIDELIVAQGRYQIGDVFLGRIENVLPGIDAAFVNIGASEKNGFIHVTDLGPLKRHKNAASINELLDPHQKVIVQVMKEPTGSKGPRLTGNISLPGRYLVLQPNGQGVNISRRITSENERNRLRALGVLIKPPGTGLLIRSESNEINEELLINDLESLLKQWESIQTAAENSAPPVLLNREEEFINRVLRDCISPDLNKVIVDNPEAVERAKNFLGKESNIVVDYHKEAINLFEYYKINTTIFSALNPRVDLPSGGYIIIEPTEALTVIDVNSGSFTKSANSRETVLLTNCEAAIEIARQLKLRNIGGVIIIDFIDMESRRDQLQLLEYFTSAIKDDKSRPQIAQLTELGLVELTRKRQGQNIYELFSKTCSDCNGLGHLVDIPSKNDIQPLASKAGLIQVEESTKKTSASIEVNNLKINNTYVQDINPESSTKNVSESINQDNYSESSNNKQESEIINIVMDEDQEHVYSYLGLNPTLLINDQPSTKNVLINLVRPGEDQIIISDESEKEVVKKLTKRTKKAKAAKPNEVNQKNIDGSAAILADETTKYSKKDDTIELEVSISQSNQTGSIESELIVEDSNSELTESDLEIDDPRRRRRRSSAS